MIMKVDIAFSEKNVLPKTFRALDIILEVVSRVAHRLFVGLPLTCASPIIVIGGVFKLFIFGLIWSDV
jgi:hypothetical protein